MMSVKLTEVVRNYGELRPREIMAQEMVLNHCARIIRDENLNEEVILDSLIEHRRSSTLNETKLSKMVGKRKVLTITRKDLLKTIYNFRSSILIVLLYFLIGAVFMALVGVMVAQKYRIEETIEIEKFMFNAYSKLANVNKNQLNVHLLLVYGSYFRPGNVRPAELDEMNSIDELVRFFVEMRPKFPVYLAAREADQLKAMVFGDCCRQLSDKFVWYDLNVKLCKQIPATQKGLIGLMIFEKELLTELRRKALTSTDFLKETETRMGFNPLLADSMAPDYLRYKIVHYAIMESMINLLFESLAISMNQRLEQISHTVQQVCNAITIFVVITSLAAGAVVYSIYQGDLRTSLERFRNIDADLLYHHHVIKRSLNNYCLRRL